MTFKYVSPSSWEKFSSCKLSWASRYVFEEPDTDSAPALRGRAFHEAAELLYSHPPEMRGANLTEACRDAMVDEYASGYAALGGTTDELATLMARWFQGLTAIETPCQVDVVSTEETFEGLELNGTPVKLVTDRVSNVRERQGEVCALTDYKTGAKWPARRQMVMGAAAIEKVHGVKVPKAHLYYVNTGEKVEVLTGPVAQRSVLDSLAEVWDEMREAELTGNFPANPSGLCGFCSHLEKCSAGKKHMEKRRRTS